MALFRLPGLVRNIRREMAGKGKLNWLADAGLHEVGGCAWCWRTAQTHVEPLTSLPLLESSQTWTRDGAWELIS